MLQKEIKITFTAQAVKHQPAFSGIGKDSGEPFDIQESIVITDMMKDGFKFKAVEINIVSEDSLAGINTEAMEGKTFTGIKASGTNKFYVQLEDIKLPA